MSTHEHSRRVHELVDAIKDGYTPDRADVDFLRSFLPELPKQKTLEEIIEHVNEAWAGTRSNTWWGDGSGVGVYLEDWLSELREQLRGLKDEPANTPALPAGMRLADHEQYGRVVVSPEKDISGRYAAFHLDNWNLSGVAYHHVDPDALTFIDTKSAAPAHPEFLETEADYENAPEGTIVAKDDISTAWIKRCGAWKSTDGDRGVRCPNWKVGHRIILRWGWKK